MPRRRGIKGEVFGKNRTYYLRHLFIDRVKQRAKDSGMSQGECLEWAVNATEKAWSELFCKENAKSDKDKQKNIDLIDARKMGKRELMRYASKTSAERHERDIIYGRHDVNVDYNGFMDFMKVDPLSIMQKLKNKFKKRPDGYVQQAWQKYHG